MVKITFMGAGSTIFAKNVLGDCLCVDSLKDCEICLYDIDAERLKESELMIQAINKNINNDRATIKTFLGVEQRKDALRSADFVVNAIQVGFLIIKKFTIWLESKRFIIQKFIML
jgi:alpha-galactosidase